MEHAVKQHMNSRSAQSSENFFGKNTAPCFFPAVRTQPGRGIESVSAPIIQAKCAACEEEEIHRKPSDNILQRDPDASRPIDLDVPSNFDEEPKRPPYVNQYQLVFAPLGSGDVDNKINFGDFNLDLIQRGKIDPRDFAEDYANLWKADYQLSANLGLGRAVGKLYGLGARLDTKLLKPVRKVVRKIPIISPLAGAIKFEPPSPQGGDWDRYLADKFATSGLDAAVSGDYAAYNSESGFVFTINIIEKKWK